MTRRSHLPWDVALVVLGVALFGVFAHTHSWFAVGIVGLVAAGLALARWGVADPDARRLFGLADPPSALPFIAYLVLSAAVGVTLGSAYRDYLGQTPLPQTLRPFCIVAVTIGICEEFVYRGFVYGRTCAWGVAIATLVSASGHTLYKCCLLLFPPAGLQPDLWSLAFWTFLVGSLFALMRAYLGSTLLPAVAHGAFDLIAYGDAVQAPPWVWS